MRTACLVMLTVACVMPAVAGETMLLIHGGAGAPSRSELPAGREAAVRAALAEALRAGHAVLSQGGSALDAVTAPLVILEDSPLFNAGRGAALNAAGQVELDASIMDGRTQSAGAVAGVHRTRNPVRLARAVMERSAHVMLIGDGAEQFGASVGIEMVAPAWFITDDRRRELERAREKARRGGAPGARLHFGTIGAVALDAQGHLAAATSTGGITNKLYGRVGDSPLIGAGTWADARCAVSATGWGEYFIRVGAARDVCARLEYHGETLAAAAASSLAAVAKLGGDGGLIALDSRGNAAMPFNTDGMYRGSITGAGEIRIDIWR